MKYNWPDPLSPLPPRKNSKEYSINVKLNETHVKQSNALLINPQVVALC